MTRKSDAEKKAALASDLQAMFQTLEARPVPDAIRSVVDQLDDGQAQPKPARRRGAGAP
jgi:hypothetical protein